MPIKKENKGRIEDLCDYLRKNIEKGYSVEALKWALVKQGNPRLEVEKAVAIVSKESVRMMKKVESMNTLQNQTPSQEQSSQEPVVEPEKKPFWKRILGLN